MSENKYKIYARYIKFAVNLKKKKNLICEMCGEQKIKGRELVCHHIIPVKKIYDFEMIMDESNILVLCHACHALIHRTRLGDSGNASKEFTDGQGFNVGSMNMLKNIERNING